MPRQMPTFTKTPPEVVAAFEAARPDRPDVERRTMFSYPAYFVKGNMFAFTFGPKIAVRLGAPKAGQTQFEVMPGHAMKEYVEVPASGSKGAALRRWVADGLAYADTLPPRASSRGAVKSAAKAGAKKATS